MDDGTWLNLARFISKAVPRHALESRDSLSTIPEHLLGRHRAIA